MRQTPQRRCAAAWPYERKFQRERSVSALTHGRRSDAAVGAFSACRRRRLVNTAAAEFPSHAHRSLAALARRVNFISLSHAERHGIDRLDNVIVGARERGA